MSRRCSRRGGACAAPIVRAARHAAAQHAAAARRRRRAVLRRAQRRDPHVPRREGGLGADDRADRAPRHRPGPQRAPRRRPPRAAVAAPGGDERLPAAARGRRAEGDAARAAARRRRCCTTRSGGRCASRRPRTSSAPGSSPSTTARSRSTPPGCPGRTRSGIPLLRSLDAPRLPRRRRRHVGRRPARGLRARRDDRRCASASIRRSRRSPTCAARTTCSTSADSAARRASSSCSTRRRARASPGSSSSSAAGPIEERVRRLAERLGIADRVRMYPFIGERATACALVCERARRRHARRARDVRPRRLRGGRERRERRDVLDGAVGRAHARHRPHVRARATSTGCSARSSGAGRPSPTPRPRRALGRRCSWGAAFAAETIALERLAGRPLARRRSRAEPRRRSGSRRRAAPCRRARRCAPTGARARGADGRRYAFTCPAPPRYRHMWHWDSCFHAIAWCAIDPARAREELRTVLRSGRPDGFLPHTVFWDAPAGWRRAPLYATRGFRGDWRTETIGPPLLAFAWEIVADASRDDDPAFRAEATARAGRAPRLARLPPRPRRGRPADDPAARRVGPRRLAEVRARCSAG